MKKFIVLSMTVVFFLFCSKKEKDETQLVNEWRLIEVLADPGDGSGQYEPVNSDKSIQFFSDGTVQSNQSLCGFDPNYAGTGIYDTTEGVIIPDDCFDPLLRISFRLEGANLILHHPCIEECGEKYVRVSN